MSKYTRGLLAVILAVVLVLPAAAFAMPKLRHGVFAGKRVRLGAIRQK